MTNAYPQPQSLGVDRWLALIAARQLAPGWACVIDAGTALTIDALDAAGLHLGGLIIPGSRMIEARPENLIGDKAYDSDQLDEQLRAQGTEMIAPHRSNRHPKRKTQDARRLRRHERRWIVERFFAWIQWQRRLLVRWEYYPINFLGFVQLAALCILLKRS